MSGGGPAGRALAVQRHVVGGDRQWFQGLIGVRISDPDGRPDPNLEPAFTPGASLLLFGKRGSLCRLERSVFFRSYRDYSYTGRLEVRYEFRTPKRPGVRAQTKRGRVALVKRGPVVSPASYDYQIRRWAGRSTARAAASGD